MGLYVTVSCDQCSQEYSDAPPVSYTLRRSRDDFGWKVNMRDHSAICDECLSGGDDE